MKRSRSVSKFFLEKSFRQILSMGLICNRGFEPKSRVVATDLVVYMPLGGHEACTANKSNFVKEIW